MVTRRARSITVGVFLIVVLGLLASCSRAKPQPATASASPAAPATAVTHVPAATPQPSPIVAPSPPPAATATPAPTPTPRAVATPLPATPSATPIPSPTATGTAIEIPAAGERVTLPLHLLAHVGQPGQQVTARLRWQDGTQRTYTIQVLRDSDGRGLVVGTPPWWPDVPPQPKSQPATLEILDASGSILARQQLTVLAPGDPDTMTVQLFWTVSGTELVRPETRSIVRTADPASAALRELLWGPPPASQIGYGTALPLPAEVLAFRGRTTDWGNRVQLRSLTVADGVATADFSRELAAYAGGSLRVKLIHDQIVQTLMQFPNISSVQVAIEGRTEGVLQP